MTWKKFHIENKINFFLLLFFSGYAKALLFVLKKKVPDGALVIVVLFVHPGVDVPVRYQRKEEANINIILIA